MIELETSLTEQVTQLLPVPVTPLAESGYDMTLAALLAQLCDITPEELIARTQEANHA